MSNAAAVTIVGRAGTYPQLSMGPTGDRVNFRIVATERWFDKAADKWVDGDEFGVTVVCWKTLATSVLNTVRKGDPVIVSGRIATRRFEKNGTTQYFTEVKADFVGLDVARTASRFTRIPMEPRDTEQQDQVEDPGVEARPGDAAEGSPSGDRQPSWDPADGEPNEREGELVSVE